MRLTITDTNFTDKKPWLFKCTDGFNHEIFIMDSPYNKKHKIKSFITYLELDYFDKGTSFLGTVDCIDGLYVVTSIYTYDEKKPSFFQKILSFFKS